MNIDSIKNGIVIDHIQAKMGLEIYDVLNLGELDCSVAIITNARSEKMGRKDIIKIDRAIDLDLDILGYLDPNITVNIIKDDVRVEKYHVELPKEIKNIIKCKNCGQIYYRVRKPNNLQKYRCGVCRGKLILIVTEQYKTN